MKGKHYAEFSKLFDQLIYRHDVPAVFDDFLSLSVSALALGRAEQLYQDTIQRYRPDEQPMFGKMFAAMVLAYDENSSPDGGWCDILGSFFEEHNGKFGRDARGQFFTPTTVCDFMAKVVAEDEPPAPGTTVNDCACGSGRNLIAHSRVHPANRMRCFYVGQDVDQRCVKMTAINMALFGLSGVVIHQNTITMETWGGYRIWLPETGMGISPLSKEQAIQCVLTTKSEPQVTTDTVDDTPVIPRGNGTVVQLNLF